jgi:hypothetical protein
MAVLLEQSWVKVQEKTFGKWYCRAITFATDMDKSLTAARDTGSTANCRSAMCRSRTWSLTCPMA